MFITVFFITQKGKQSGCRKIVNCRHCNMGYADIKGIFSSKCHDLKMFIKPSKYIITTEFI